MDIMDTFCPLQSWTNYRFAALQPLANSTGMMGQIDVLALLSRPKRIRCIQKPKSANRSTFCLSAYVLTQWWQSLYPVIPRQSPVDLPVLQDLTFKREIDKPHFCVERNNNVKDK